VDYVVIKREFPKLYKVSVKDAGKERRVADVEGRLRSEGDSDNELSLCPVGVAFCL
jgi:hypothetical protein